MEIKKRKTGYTARGKKSIYTALRLPIDINDKINEIATKNNCSKSAVIIHLLNQAL